MKILIIFCGLFLLDHAAHASSLIDTAESFKTVVKSISESKSLNNDNLDKIAQNFATERSSKSSSLAKEKCHIVCTMLAELLGSGDSMLVSLYYKMVDSYTSDREFLFKTTGYKWGSHAGNKCEQRIYDAGARLRTCEQAFNKYTDAWSVHQSWANALLFGTKVDASSLWIQFPEVWEAGQKAFSKDPWWQTLKYAWQKSKDEKDQYNFYPENPRIQWGEESFHCTMPKETVYVHGNATDELLLGLLTSAQFKGRSALVINDAHLLSEDFVLKQLIPHFARITAVGFKRAYLTPSAFTQLFSVLAKNTNLRSLNLYGCTITGDQKKIDLQDVTIQWEGIAALDVTQKDGYGTWLPEVVMDKVVAYLKTCQRMPEVKGLTKKQMDSINTSRKKQ